MAYVMTIRRSVLAAIAATGFLGGAASAATVTVSITNLQPGDGVFLTPLFAAFHGGTFDPFNAGATASASVEALAEDGITSGLEADASAAGANAGVLANAAGFPGAPVIDPGETAKLRFTVNATTDRYFSFLSMVIPSNDFFIGNDNPLAYEVFDVAGLFTGLGVIDIYGGDVWDAGSEVNDNNGAAFNTNGGTGTDEGGTVSLASMQVNGLSNLLGQPRAAGGTVGFVPGDRDLLARIEINVVPVPAAMPLLLAGLGALGVTARRRRRTQ